MHNFSSMLSFPYFYCIKTEMGLVEQRSVLQGHRMEKAKGELLGVKIRKT